MKLAIVAAPGLGDGLIFHTAAHNLRLTGFKVTLFNTPLIGLAPWLPGSTLLPLDEPDLTPFDALFLQHDNSARSKQIASRFRPYIFYSSHHPSKHGPLDPTRHFVADPKRSMVDNLLTCLKTLFHLPSPTPSNGLTPPPTLLHRKFPRRIALHPTTSCPKKNWSWPSFQRLAHLLAQKGYEPHFLTTPSNEPLFPTLPDLATFLYESGAFIGNDSGPGHLASALDIPPITLASSLRQIRLWRPGWRTGPLLTPPPYLPNWKGLRLQEWGWRHLIRPERVVRALERELGG